MRDEAREALKALQKVEVLVHEEVAKMRVVLQGADLNEAPLR